MIPDDTISIDRLTAKRIIYDLQKIIDDMLQHCEWDEDVVDPIQKALDDIKAAHDDSVKKEIDDLFKQHDRLMDERDRVLGLRTKLFPDKTE